MSELNYANIEKVFSPTPKKRVENPIKTELQPGDLVKALAGLANSKIGFVVIERNGNYEDSEPNAGEESIGVGFAEQASLAPELKKAVEQLTDKPTINTVIRWFDSPDQLEVMEKATSEDR